MIGFYMVLSCTTITSTFSEEFLWRLILNYWRAFPSFNF